MSTGRVVALAVGWLVTGGAGFIGAHVVRAFQTAGLDPVVIDDLSTGRPERVPRDVPLVRADVRDPVAVHDAIRRYGTVGVVHLAARKDVAESTADPLGYYRENLDGLRGVLLAVTGCGLKYVLFSSSAAVYGTPKRCPVTEDDPTFPENPYGRTKLVGEWMLRDAAESAGFSFGALRYFNVAGAADPELGDIGQTNLVPRLLHAAAEGYPATVYGTDFSTVDGSGVRDYVHVADIADAHVRTAQGLVRGEVREAVLNVGRGEGASVLEMVRAVRQATGRDLEYVAAPRRVGDPAAVVASPARIAGLFGWRATRDLTDIVTSAWAAYRRSGSADALLAVGR